MEVGDETVVAWEASGSARTPGRERARVFVEGDKIGRYVVLARLGAGGMGVVYAAYDPELDRKVALKLLRAEKSGPGDNTTGRSRLVREAQAMARLSHPNVIAVHDVGTIDDQVFVAMEFVAGATLAVWLKTQPRSLEQILAVFVSAARGLAAAHEAGLVHRDFKPDNVMIGEDGRVRVLDFGLARSIRASAATASLSGSSMPSPSGVETQEVVPLPLDATLSSLRSGTASQTASSSTSSLDIPLTMTGAMMGTPAYMAPEQHQGLDTDARSDQFSYCVALWEALFGTRPYRGDTLAVLAFQILHGELTPPAPSTRVVPRRVRVALERGLARKPDERFPSMDALARELELRPDHTRRNRLVGALLALTLCGAAAGLWLAKEDPVASCVARGVQSVEDVWESSTREDIARAFAAAAPEAGEAAWEKTEEAMDAWLRQWLTINGEVCQGRRNSASVQAGWSTVSLDCQTRQLRRAAGLVDAWRISTPEVVQQAVIAIESLPRPEACRDAQSILRAAPPPADLATQDKVDAIHREIDAAYAIYYAGRYGEVVTAGEEIVARARTLAYDPAVAESLLLLAEAQLGAGQAQKAVTSVEDALWYAASSGAIEFTARAWLAEITIRSIATSEFARAEWALPHARAALARLGDPDPLVARYLLVAGVALGNVDKEDEAIDSFVAALEICERAQLGPVFEADIRNNLATPLKSKGRKQEAVAELERAKGLWEEALGERHPKVGRALVNLAQANSAIGKKDLAIEQLRLAVDIFEQALGRGHFHVAAALNGLGLMLASRHEDMAAKEAYLEALAILERAMGEGHAHTTNVLNNLGLVCMELGEYAESEAYQRRALKNKRALHGDESVEAALGHDNLGDLFSRMGDWDRALIEYSESLRILALGEDRQRYQAYPQGRLVAVALAMGETAEARRRCDLARVGLQVPDPSLDTVALVEVQCFAAIQVFVEAAGARSAGTTQELGEAKRLAQQAVAALDDPQSEHVRRLALLVGEDD